MTEDLQDGTGELRRGVEGGLGKLPKVARLRCFSRHTQKAAVVCMPLGLFWEWLPACHALFQFACISRLWLLRLDSTDFHTLQTPKQDICGEFGEAIMTSTS